jgi:hypothetical protein
MLLFRHIREILAGKPMLVLEMDEHSSRAGILLLAFLNITRHGRTKGEIRPAPALKPHDAFEESSA